MIDRKTNHLELPLPDEKNMLEDDCPRIRQAFQKLDEHAKTADAALAARLAQANAADEAIAALQGRAAALEAVVTELRAGLDSLAASVRDDLAEAVAALERKIIRAAEAPQDTAVLWLNTENDTLNHHDGASWKSIVGRYADA